MGLLVDYFNEHKYKVTDVSDREFVGGNHPGLVYKVIKFILSDSDTNKLPYRVISHLIFMLIKIVHK